jgi:hypothetical protein
MTFPRIRIATSIGSRLLSAVLILITIGSNHALAQVETTLPASQRVTINLSAGMPGQSQWLFIKDSMPRWEPIRRWWSSSRPSQTAADKIVISYTNGTADQPKSSGIEIR